MGQNQSSQDHANLASSSARMIKVLEEKNREKDEVIKRQSKLILKEEEEETAAILRKENEILEIEKKFALQALEEESVAKKKAIIEKERVVREQERQLKEQQRIIQIQKEELEKHKEITKNVLTEVVQRQAEKPVKRFNHQYNFNELPSSSKAETKLQNMQIGYRDKSSITIENKPKNLYKFNDMRDMQWPNDQKSGRGEPATKQNVQFGHQQMFNQQPHFPNPMLHTMAAFSPPPQSFGQNMTYWSLPEKDSRFVNFNVPPPNLPHLSQHAVTNMRANNQHLKQNSSHHNKVRDQKSVSESDSTKESMTDHKYDQANVAKGSVKKQENHETDSDKDSTAETKNNSNKPRRRRRYGRTKVYTNTNMNSDSNEGAKAQQLDNNSKQQLDNNSKKPEKRMIGKFQCPKCSKSWNSATTYVGVTQQCSRCRIDVTPTKLESMKKHREDLCGKCKELGRNCREQSTAKSTKVPEKKENIDELI